MKFRSIVIAAVLAASSAQAKEAPPPPPAPKPDFAKVRETVEATIKSTLFDPMSVQFVYTNGFQWGFAKPLIGKRTWGWIACGTYNAKNRMGGYVGASGFWAMSDGSGTISWGEIGATMSTCDTAQRAELQPELAATAMQSSIAASAPTLGIADELGKLADLKAKGVITQAEFDAQKSKLLSK